MTLTGRSVKSIVRHLQFPHRCQRCIIISSSTPKLRGFSTVFPRYQIANNDGNGTSQFKTNSVDQTEVSHFNALASTWWDPKGSSRLLHLMNPLRVEFIQTCLARSSLLDHNDNTEGSGRADPIERGQEEVDVEGKERKTKTSGYTYLDIGCGGGIYTESIARLPTTATVLGIDPSPQVFAIAVSHAKQDPSLRHKLTYRQTSIDNLPTSATFDVVSLFEVIEHVPYPAAFLEAAIKHVRPGGWLVLSTIARTWTSWVTTKLVAEDLLRIVPRGTHDWKKYINEGEMREFFEGREDCVEMVTMGVVYVPGLGWRKVPGGERLGNYFFAVKKAEEGVL